MSDFTKWMRHIQAITCQAHTWKNVMDTFLLIYHRWSCVCHTLLCSKTIVIIILFLSRPRPGCIIFHSLIVFFCFFVNGLILSHYRNCTVFGKERRAPNHGPPFTSFYD